MEKWIALVVKTKVLNAKMMVAATSGATLRTGAVKFSFATKSVGPLRKDQDAPVWMVTGKSVDHFLFQRAIRFSKIYGRVL